MSALQPTPETDDIFDAYARCACGTACIRAKMQQIERERDSAKTLNRSLLYQLEAQAVQIEALRKTLIESEAYQAGLVADFEAMREAIKDAYYALAYVYNDGTGSCAFPFRTDDDLCSENRFHHVKDALDALKPLLP